METPLDGPGGRIDQLHDAWCEALRGGDVEGALSLLAPDYVLWAPGAPPVVGRDAVRSMLVSALAVYELSPSFESEERFVSGDLAVEVGWDIQVALHRETGDVTTRRQRVMLVMRRSEEDGWRYARGMSQPDPSGP